eukprot:EG_transcript_27518
MYFIPKLQFFRNFFAIFPMASDVNPPPVSGVDSPPGLVIAVEGDAFHILVHFPHSKVYLLFSDGGPAIFKHKHTVVQDKGQFFLSGPLFLSNQIHDHHLLLAVLL